MVSVYGETISNNMLNFLTDKPQGKPENVLLLKSNLHKSKIFHIAVFLTLIHPLKNVKNWSLISNNSFTFAFFYADQQVSLLISLFPYLLSVTWPVTPFLTIFSFSYTCSSRIWRKMGVFK